MSDKIRKIDGITKESTQEMIDKSPGGLSREGAEEARAASGAQ